MSDTITIRIKKPGLIWITMVLSILLHLVIAVFHWPSLVQTNDGKAATGPIQITLAPKASAKQEGNRAKEKAEKAKQVLPKPKPKQQVKPKPKQKPAKKAPAKRKQSSKPKPVKPTTIKPVESETKVLVQTQSQSEAPSFTVPESMVPEPSKQAATPPTPPMPTAKNAPTDMMSLIKQRRQARAAEGDPSAIIALEQGKLAGQSVRKSVDEIVEQNLRQPGTNGIFTVTTLNRFEGTFSFQGWRGEFSNAQRRFYRVDTFNTSDDIRVLMVNKMIDIIRTHYAGDFQWQSMHLDALVTLSARPQDHDKLVRFLLTEFQAQFDQFLRYRR